MEIWLWMYISGNSCYNACYPVMGKVTGKCSGPLPHISAIISFVFKPFDVDIHTEHL